ncbi:YfhO family protein [Flavobacterium sediminilitoris]|uniref:YfhO family protein n=1 Tax=Flavobacterium sediminilitoris TaxID=2024526 RepID=A0ABY4HJE6_9FLAO|nr:MULTISPECIES: YfhO family protein [Flavobacterium]UOX32845.1 YfhO family protein [Flavobacterium sediminilitoris]
MKKIQSLLPHFIAIVGFVLVAIIYFYPVLEGKKIYQSDIAQYTGMAKEQNDFRKENNAEPYWTNSAFGGMPTYQLGANYPHNYVKKLDTVLRFLPRPADYLFLYFIGFYILLMVLKIDPLKAFFGALAFGFSTYLIIILGVGHNAKAHAIAYMPMVLAGVLLVFQRKYIIGGILTMIAAALEIQANHFQMTYYLLILLLVVAGFYIYQFIKEKAFTELGKVIGVFAVAGLLAIGANATNLLATSEYADYSIRGKSELTFNPDGSQNTTNSSMKYEYITEYSYGIGESFNLIAPKLFGGGNNETLDEKSSLYNFLINYGASHNEALQTVSYYGKTYWGDQPIVAAPAYIGAIVFFLAVLGLFNDKRKIKYAFLIGAIISLLLSWGKNFDFLTRFFIDYVPLYDKFRAVSSIQVVLELCIPILALMGLQSFFNEDKEKQLKSLMKASAVSLGLILFLLLFKGIFFNFSGSVDQRLIEMFAEAQDRSFAIDFIKALKEDRKSMYVNDLMRSGGFILIVGAILWLFIKNKLGKTTAIVMVGVLMVSDLFLIDKNYVSAKDFISARQVDTPFEASEVDNQILKDTSVYRVYEIQGRLQARTSYFHKSVGGYSAVRPRRFDQLFEYNIENNINELGSSIDFETLSFTKNNATLDALNVKYVIVPTGKGDIAITNPFANGNAWFVEKIKMVNSADEEMKALDNLDTKKTAIINTNELKVKGNLPNEFRKDSLASIKLNVYKPNYLKYTANNTNDGFAVFSETYYKNGWKATIDGKNASIFKVDYVLRGLQIPAGKHTIEFTFDPQVVKTGSSIALMSSIGMILLILGGVYFEVKRNKIEVKK